MVIATPKSPMIKLLIITELLNANNTLKPFLKNKDDLSNSINELIGTPINLPEIKKHLLLWVMRKINSLPIGEMLKDCDSSDFTKKSDEFVFSFSFSKQLNDESFNCIVEIRFKKNSSGSIEAYKKYSYDGPSGIVFSDFLGQLNKALLPMNCASLINNLFELEE